MRLIYLLLFIAPQVLLYLYLRDRLPDPTNPRRARLVRGALAAVFTLLNFPWLFVARRVLFGTVWGTGQIPYLGPWIAWQIMGWGMFGAVTLYALGWAIYGFVVRVRRPAGADRPVDPPERQLSRRQFLARATYAYAGAGAALSAYGIWNAYRLPDVTRRTLWFDDLPAGLDGLRILHLSDVHAGIHMRRHQMEAVVARANALRPDVILQTGDMIDIDPAYIPDYVAAFRELQAPHGVITCLGNHDHYTGTHVVVNGVREAGQILVRDSTHIVERGGAALAVIGIDDPEDWQFDDPQHREIAVAMQHVPPEAFRILLAHRPGAFDGAAPHGIPLTLSGHIHGGQIYLPVIGWSAGRLITKYVMGHFANGKSQLYVSRGIGVVGVPIRIFVPPEIALLELRRTVGLSDRRTVGA